jgi:hypothetical protein
LTPYIKETNGTTINHVLFESRAKTGEARAKTGVIRMEMGGES